MFKMLLFNFMRDKKVMERFLKIIVVIIIFAAFASDKALTVFDVAIKEYLGIDVAQYTQYLKNIPSLEEIKKQLADLMNGAKK